MTMHFNIGVFITFFPDPQMLEDKEILGIFFYFFKDFIFFFLFLPKAPR